MSVSLCTTALPSTEFLALFSLPFFTLLFFFRFVPCHTLVAPRGGAASSVGHKEKKTLPMFL